MSVLLQVGGSVLGRGTINILICFEAEPAAVVATVALFLRSFLNIEFPESFPTILTQKYNEYNFYKKGKVQSP